MRRQDRLAARKEGHLDTAAFLKLSNKFVDLANRENKKIEATQLQLAFLYAAARYNAFVGKTIMDVDRHEEFVEQMVDQYREMLRQHLADEALEPADNKLIKTEN